MIAEHQEPKGLAPDAKAIGDFLSSSAFKANAEMGSTALRNAILRAKGHAIPVTTKREVPQLRLPPRQEAHLATLCPCCNAPVKANQRFVAHIQATVAAYYEVPLGSMTSDQRYGKLAHPRQIAMFLATELTGKSLSEIGRRFRRDHTTVIYAIKAVTKRIEQDPEVEFDVELLRERLTA